MNAEVAPSCPNCHAAIDPGSAFCTGCGSRITQPTVPLATVSPSCPSCAAPLGDDAAFCTNCGRSVNKAAVEPAAPQPGIADTAACPSCGAPLDNDAAFCVNCGTKLANESTSSAETPVSAATSPTVPDSVASGSAGAAVQPAFSSDSALTPQGPAYVERSVGPRKIGPIVVAGLVLVILAAGAYLWLSHSGSSTHSVLILTPQVQNPHVSANQTIDIGVAAQGDSGDGLVFAVTEAGGGSIEPAGVSLQGQQVIFNALYHAPSKPGIYHIVATSKANRTASVTIAVRVRR